MDSSIVNEAGPNRRRQPSGQSFAAVFGNAALEQLFKERIAQSTAVGRDGTRVREFEANLPDEIEVIQRKVLGCKYRFTRYRERLISKGPYKAPRILSIPTVRDRLTLRAVYEFLSLMFPDAATKRPHSYIRRIREVLAGAEKHSVFVRVDVKDYYGSIDRKMLIKNIRRRVRSDEALTLIASAINTPTIAESDVGIPQGLSVSNALAAIYLMNVDKEMERKWRYFRYVDDVLIICGESEGRAVYDEFRSRLKRKKLSCHELDRATGKSYIARIGDGVDYLGFHITDKNVSIRQSSFRRMFSNLNVVFTQYKYSGKADKLIWRLNLKITGCIFKKVNYGWMFFFLQTENIGQLAQLDRFVARRLKELGLENQRPNIKRLVKAYHEIRFNFDRSTYVPNFDAFSIEDMKAALQTGGGWDVASIQASSDAEIETAFFGLIRRETSELEKDLADFFS